MGGRPVAISVAGDAKSSGQPMGWANKYTGPRLGRMACAMVSRRLIRRKRTSTTNERHRNNADSWAGIRTGGGQPREISMKNCAIGKNRVGDRPVSLSNWSDWCGPNATDIQNKMIGRMMGAWFPTHRERSTADYSINRRYAGEFRGPRNTSPPR